MRKGNLARDYADARIEAESKHSKRFWDDAHRPFEDVTRQLAESRRELISAQELLEYMSS